MSQCGEKVCAVEIYQWAKKVNNEDDDLLYVGCE